MIFGVEESDGIIIPAYPGFYEMRFRRCGKPSSVPLMRDNQMAHHRLEGDGHNA
jgi:hypothetical protein